VVRLWGSRGFELPINLTETLGPKLALMLSLRQRSDQKRALIPIGHPGRFSVEVRRGSCVTSVTGSNGCAQLYRR
jgi:hypothetical protein